MAITYHAGRRIQSLESDYTRSVVHSVTSGTTDYSLTSGNRGHANEIHGSSPLIGQTIGSISFEFKGTDTGLIRGLILSGATGGIVADCGTIDSSTVTSSYAWYEFTCSSYTLQNGDRIAFELLGSGTTLKARGTSSSVDAGLRWYIVPSGAYPKNLNYQNTNEINVKVSDYKDPKPTNVQVGSRLEETDTRKMYHYGLSGDITTDGSYTVLKYRSDGTFTPTSAFNVEYLVVAGGAGGGSGYGGGGGAGGLKTSTGFGVTSQSYPITVGVGGANGDTGISGGNSIFSSITSTGGGGGRTYYSPAGNGGSGGGGSLTNNGGDPAGTGIAGQGNNGANGSGYGGYAGNGGGGGGGAGSAGSGINGGAGSSSSITGTSLFYAGGGGASRVNLAGGVGGSGIGGTGGYSNKPTGGAVNTGSGGGGGSGSDYGGGSDGVVILRFLTSGNTYTTSLSTNAWTEEGI